MFNNLLEKIKIIFTNYKKNIDDDQITIRLPYKYRNMCIKEMHIIFEEETNNEK